MTGSGRIAVVLALGYAAGCALVYEGKYDWDQGWREGQVVALGTGRALPLIPYGDCRQRVAEESVAHTQYADVQYDSEGRWIRHRVVPVPPGLTIEQGQHVYVNVSSCDGIEKAFSGS